MKQDVDLMGKEYLSVPEAAVVLRISRQAVYKAVREKRVRASRFCGLLVIRRKEVERYNDTRVLRVMTGQY
jgi:excisionase family DNA binding protein